MPRGTEVCPYCRAAFLIEIEDNLSPESESVLPQDIPTAKEKAEIYGNETKILGNPATITVLALTALILFLAVLIVVLLKSNRSNIGSHSQLVVQNVIPEQKANTNSNGDQTWEGESEQEEGFPLDVVPADSDQSASTASDPDLNTEEMENIQESYHPDSSFPNSTPDTVHGDLIFSDEAEHAGDETEEIPRETNLAVVSAKTDSSIGEIPESENTPSDAETSTPLAESPGSKSDTGDEDFDVDTYAGGDMTILFSALSKTVFEPINISKRLNLPLRQIRLAHAGLSDCVRLFYQLTAVPVELDWHAFPVPVSMWEKRTGYDAVDLTAGQFLNEFSTAFGLDVSILDDRVCLGPPEHDVKSVERVIFDCEDLLESPNQNIQDASEQDAESDLVFPEVFTLPILEKALRDLVLDVSFCTEENPHNIELSSEGKSLTLTADKKTIERANIFFDRIRSLRHLPQKKINDAEVLIPENLCWENLLSTEISLTFLRPVPLSEVLILLERNYKIHFFFDYAVIPGGGTALETPVKLIAADQPIDQILLELLTPLGLGYAILTEDLLAVTSMETGNIFDAEIQFYAAPDDEITLDEASALAKRIKESVAPKSWQTESTSGGTIWIDPVSHSFYIRQTVANQLKIRRLLQAGLVRKETSL